MAHCVKYWKHWLKTYAEGFAPSAPTQDEYRHGLARELRQQPPLFASYAARVAYEKTGVQGCLSELSDVLPLGLLAVACLVFGFCLAASSGRSGRSGGGPVTLPSPMSEPRLPRYPAFDTEAMNANMERLRKELEEIQKNLNRLERKSTTQTRRRRDGKPRKPPAGREQR